MSNCTASVSTAPNESTRVYALLQRRVTDEGAILELMIGMKQVRRWIPMITGKWTSHRTKTRIGYAVHTLVWIILLLTKRGTYQFTASICCTKIDLLHIHTEMNTHQLTIQIHTKCFQCCNISTSFSYLNTSDPKPWFRIRCNTEFSYIYKQPTCSSWIKCQQMEIALGVPNCDIDKILNTSSCHHVVSRKFMVCEYASGSVRALQNKMECAQQWGELWIQSDAFKPWVSRSLHSSLP